MKKFKIIIIILLSLNLIAVTVAIILSSISLSKQKYNEIYSSEEVGFIDVFGNEPIEKMYVYFVIMSHDSVEFYDEEIVNELKEILNKAVFQKLEHNIDLYKDNPYTNFRLSMYTENEKVQIGICGDNSILIRTRESECIYKTNVAREIYDLAYKAAYLYIPEDVRHNSNSSWPTPEGLE